MNLENLNLVELNAQEICEVEGGGWISDVASDVADAVVAQVELTIAVAEVIVLGTLGALAGLGDGLKEGAKART